jgi:hypothetical protein
VNVPAFYVKACETPVVVRLPAIMPASFMSMMEIVAAAETIGVNRSTPSWERMPLVPGPVVSLQPDIATSATAAAIVMVFRVMSTSVTARDKSAEIVCSISTRSARLFGEKECSVDGVSLHLTGCTKLPWP